MRVTRSIGQFEFSAADSKVDIDALVERYADPDCWNVIKLQNCKALRNRTTPSSIFSTGAVAKLRRSVEASGASA